MVETIINNFDNLGIGSDNGAAILTLKVNSELKKCGFKKAVINSEYFRGNTFEDDLTIMFMPYMSDIDYMERRVSRNEFEGFYNHLTNLRGSTYWGDYYSLRNTTFSDQVALSVVFEGNNIEVGHYLPDRNIVLFYLPIFKDWDLGIDNKFVLQILDYVKEVTKKYSFKEVDVRNIKQRMLMEKFAKGVDNKISNINSNIDENNRHIATYNPRIVQWHRDIMDMIVEKKSLETYKENLLNGMDGVLGEVNKLKFVDSVMFGDNGIILKLQTIHIKVKDKDILMGNYTITIKPEKVEIVNDNPIDRNGSIYHHPHISGNNICFGNQGTMVNKLLAGLEFKKLTHFLYMYLSSFNQGDTFIPMSDWISGRENNDVVPSDRTYHCSYCDDDVSEGDWNSDKDMCRYSADNHSWCNECDMYVHHDEYNGDKDMCGSCVDDNFNYCNECEEYIKFNDWNSDKDMCDNCVEREAQNDSN